MAGVQIVSLLSLSFQNKSINMPQECLQHFTLNVIALNILIFHTSFMNKVITINYVILKCTTHIAIYAG